VFTPLDSCPTAEILLLPDRRNFRPGPRRSLALGARRMTPSNRHRGKGQQKVTVEHDHVHSGGQAVVGLVEPPGGDCPCISARDAVRGRGAAARANGQQW
jgi:hypothetical protein